MATACNSFPGKFMAAWVAVSTFSAIGFEHRCAPAFARAGGVRLAGGAARGGRRGAGGAAGLLQLHRRHGACHPTRASVHACATLVHILLSYSSLLCSIANAFMIPMGIAGEPYK